MAIEFSWNPEKNEWLKLNRQLNFDLVIRAFTEGAIVDDVANPSLGREKQRLILFRHQDRICVVPYVTNGNVKFLKTMFLSRDFTKLYGEKND